MSSPRVLILGHSFVRRLSSFLASSHVYSSDFGLSDSADISLFGVCGRTVDKVIQFDLDVVRNSKPDIVILELGTDDLTSLPPESVGSELEELVQSLHCEFDVRVIAVFQVIKRITPFSRLPDFNSWVLKLHLYLQVILERLPILGTLEFANRAETCTSGTTFI